jgi:CheY-like chemotaxis protein
MEVNPTNMRFVVTVLKNTGYKVLQAEDAVVGIPLALEVHRDLIFMDIQFLVMDVMEATGVSHQLGQAPPRGQTFFDASAGRPKGSEVQ